MYELDKVSDETHNGEPYGDGSAELDVFWSLQGIRISPVLYRRPEACRSDKLTLLGRLGTSVDEL